MHTAIRTVGALLLLISVFTISERVSAQPVINLDVSSLLQKASVSFSPRAGSFIAGSTFEVPIVINTQGKSINAIELHIKFNPSRLQIVAPTGQKSIIGLWVAPPSYSNTLGTLTFMGATLIVVREAVLLMFGASPMSILMIALWSWIAWRDYKFLKSLPQK